MGAKQQGATVTDGRWLTIPRTLCFIFNGNDVLLMKRAAHKRIFPNCYNGVGGHIERDEDPLTSARREIREETGLIVNNLQLRAVYNIDTNEANGIILFIFTGETKTRNVTPNSEGSLHWVPRGEVMRLALVEDLPYILPRIFAMEDNTPPLFVHVSYDNNDEIRLKFADD
ncbi:MAG: NUDIX domain-containing protein [Chloroflexi bacterium]|nr:MAG: hypothetical protein CUN54_07465 [Phototrophicales bacterium]RMF81634.1 MAG: NUDIX domain-containing protein [Chloroflexota bacterium]